MNQKKKKRMKFKVEVDDQLSKLTGRKDGDTVERLDGKQ